MPWSVFKIWGDKGRSIVEIDWFETLMDAVLCIQSLQQDSCGSFHAPKITGGIITL